MLKSIFFLVYLTYLFIYNFTIIMYHLRLNKKKVKLFLSHLISSKVNLKALFELSHEF